MAFRFQQSKSERADAMVAAGMYKQAGDPDGIGRVNSGDNYGSAYHGFPVAGIFPNVLSWQFKSAYDVNTTNVWDMANTGSGTALALLDGRGGWAKAVNAAADNDYYSYQSKGKPIAFAAGKATWFITEIIVKTVGQADIFVGLTPAIATTSIFDARVDSVGFYLVDGQSGLLRCETSNGSTANQKSTAVTMVNATKIKLAFCVDGISKVFFFVNDVFKALSVADIPTVAMGVAFAIRNGEAVANELSINTINVGMDR